MHSPRGQHQRSGFDWKANGKKAIASCKINMWSAGKAEMPVNSKQLYIIPLAQQIHFELCHGAKKVTALMVTLITTAMEKCTELHAMLHVFQYATYNAQINGVQ